MKDFADFKELSLWIKLGFGLLISLFIVARLATINADADLWGYLAFGQLFWNSSQFPYRDVFSYLPTLNP